MTLISSESLLYSSNLCRSMRALIKSTFNCSIWSVVCLRAISMLKSSKSEHLMVINQRVSEMNEKELKKEWNLPIWLFSLSYSLCWSWRVEQATWILLNENSNNEMSLNRLWYVCSLVSNVLIKFKNQSIYHSCLEIDWFWADESCDMKLWVIFLRMASLIWGLSRIRTILSSN